MLKILHFSDLHLETPFLSSNMPSSYGAWRRQDLRATLGRILTIARERKVDAVTIAGDLFEQEYIMPEIAGFLSTQFGKLSPIQVIIAPGGKDPYISESIYSIYRWPENVTIFRESHLTAIKLTSEITLWGAACPPTRIQNLFEKLLINKSGINLLLLHANCRDLSLLNQEGAYSINARNVINMGFTFALLGSSHQSRVFPDDTALIAFPGSPEPLDFESEDIGHHIVFLQIQDGKCMHELLPISRWKYINQTIDITGFTSEAQVIKSIEKLLRKSSDKDQQQPVLRITLKGDPESQLNLGDILSKIDKDVFCEIIVDSPVHYDLEMLAQEQTVRGTMVKRFLEKNGEQERNKEIGALLLALQALDGKPIGSS